MKKEIQLLKQKADSIAFIVKQIEQLESYQRKLNNTQQQMVLDAWYCPTDIEKVATEIVLVNRQIEQYERQIMEL